MHNFITMGQWKHIFYSREDFFHVFESFLLLHNERSKNVQYFYPLGTVLSISSLSFEISER